jgi:TRAP-type C4-dicarboxylate transport system substrate-binding protein
VEAQENPMAMIASASFQEVQKYLNLTEHVVSWGYVVMGDRQLQALPVALREIFQEAVQEMQDYEHQLFLAKEKELAEFLQAEGMQFVEVDKMAFQNIAEKAVYESLPADLQQIFLQIKQLDSPQTRSGNDGTTL